MLRAGKREGPKRLTRVLLVFRLTRWQVPREHQVQRVEPPPALPVLRLGDVRLSRPCPHASSRFMAEA